jgi:hypothetical protein
MLGFPLLVAYKQLGKRIEDRAPGWAWITSVGLIGLVAQMVGLLRWTFVVPVLAEQYATGGPVNQKIAASLFQVLHQYGGVLLGEHLGQLFTIIWVLCWGSRGCSIQAGRCPSG